MNQFKAFDLCKGIPMQPSKTVSIDELPENTALAVYELIARTFREYSEILYIRVPDITDDGVSVGGVEITIRKTADDSISPIAGLPEASQDAAYAG
ncbi:MAG: hypothetical protein QM684_13865 [Rhizobium sp.]|uniref:hypothetical protein n=1 Tax=Rhizobium sp. SYY.PMSO TaxID=3382192 RepID=UPI0013AF3985